jgi:hypothetical protein
MLEELPESKMIARLDPAHPRPPVELLQVAADGLEKDPARRFQSAEAMIDALQSILEGRICVRCSATFLKRLLREAARFVDNHSRLALLILMVGTAALVFAAVQLVRIALAP